MTVEQFAPLMFLGLILVMLIGFPVAFSLGALGLFCGFFAIHMGWFPANFLGNLPLNVFGILSNELLLAIPFFTLMGAILEKCGLAEDMLDSMGQLFGPVRGGLGYSVIIVGFILGAITGTVAAQVIAMALITLPVMLRYKYDMRYATGVLAASGTITQLVPPSLVLIVLADQLGRSVGDLYKGAFVPGFMLVGFYMLLIFGLAIFKPSMVPALPPEARTNDQARQTVTEQSVQFAGCAGQVAQYQEYNTNTQSPSVVITFKPAGCGIPPNPAQKVTAVELQMVRQGSVLWVLNYRRIAEAAGQPSNLAPR